MTKICTRNNKPYGWSDHRDGSIALINTVTDQRQALPYTRVPAFGQLQPASCSDHAAQSGNLKARCIKYRLNLYFMHIVFKLTELCGSVVCIVCLYRSLKKLYNNYTQHCFS